MEIGLSKKHKGITPCKQLNVTNIAGREGEKTMHMEGLRQEAT